MEPKFKVGDKFKTLRGNGVLEIICVPPRPSSYRPMTKLRPQPRFGEWVKRITSQIKTTREER
jgi:hypothetical protein